jgi:hypothetical protein
MITGYNANVHHDGRLFHVQTEDSGRAHPHVITHFYYEGTIFASEKRDYASLVDAPDLTQHVRKLMEEQHAAMMARLRGGDFDAVIAARLTGARMPAATAADSLTPALPRAGSVSRAAPHNPGATHGAAARGAAATATAAARVSAQGSPGRAREFGEGIVSPKPLDEVILDYLVEKSRDRKSGGGRGSRSEG